MALTLPPQFFRIRTLDRRVRAVRRRPFGVYVIALLQALNAVAYAAGVLTGLEPPAVTLGPSEAPEILAVLMMIAGLTVGLGLLMLKRWAWVATMLWVGAIMVVELSLYVRGEDANYLVMAVAIAQVFYLNLSDVQACFGNPRQPEPSPR